MPDPERLIDETAVLLLFTIPTIVSSTLSYAVASVTTVDIDPFAAMVITTLQPVPAGSGGCGNGLVPDAAGQIVPASAMLAPSTNNAKPCSVRISLKCLRILLMSRHAPHRACT